MERLVLGGQIGRQRDVLVLREALQFVVRFAVIVDHPLAEFLHAVARSFVRCELAELDLGHSSSDGVHHECLIRLRFAGRCVLLPAARKRRGDRRCQRNNTHAERFVSSQTSIGSRRESQALYQTGLEVFRKDVVSGFSRTMRLDFGSAEEDGLCRGAIKRSASSTRRQSRASVATRQPSAIEQVVAALARQRIEERRHRVAADETAGVREVVDARHDQAEHEQDDRVPLRFGVDQAAAALAAVVDERAEQAEDRRRRADREAGAAQQRNRQPETRPRTSSGGSRTTPATV